MTGRTPGLKKTAGLMNNEPAVFCALVGREGSAGSEGPAYGVRRGVRTAYGVWRGMCEADL